METHHTTYDVSVDLHQFLDLYLSREHSLPTIAQSLGITLPQLIQFIKLPHVQQVLDDTEAITQRREKLFAITALSEQIQELKSLSPLPPNAVAADHERRRRTLDTSRRAADLLRKFYTPTPQSPTSKASAKASQNPSPLQLTANQTDQVSNGESSQQTVQAPRPAA